MTARLLKSSIASQNQSVSLRQHLQQVVRARLSILVKRLTSVRLRLPVASTLEPSFRPGPLRRARFRGRYLLCAFEYNRHLLLGTIYCLSLSLRAPALENCGANGNNPFRVAEQTASGLPERRAVRRFPSATVPELTMSPRRFSVTSQKQMETDWRDLLSDSYARKGEKSAMSLGKRKERSRSTG